MTDNLDLTHAVRHELIEHVRDVAGLASLSFDRAETIADRVILPLRDELRARIAELETARESRVCDGERISDVYAERDGLRARIAEVEKERDSTEWSRKNTNYHCDLLAAEVERLGARVAEAEAELDELVKALGFDVRDPANRSHAERARAQNDRYDELARDLEAAEAKVRAVEALAEGWDDGEDECTHAPWDDTPCRCGTVRAIRAALGKGDGDE